MASAHGGLTLYELLYDSCGEARSRASSITSPASGTEGQIRVLVLYKGQTHFAWSLVAFGFSLKLLYTALALKVRPTPKRAAELRNPVSMSIFELNLLKFELSL